MFGSLWGALLWCKGWVMPSVNVVVLAGHMTRTPELRYTPNSKAVCDFGLAVNRKRPALRSLVRTRVGEGGFEPPRFVVNHWILSPVRLPFRHSPLVTRSCPRASSAKLKRM